MENEVESYLSVIGWTALFCVQSFLFQIFGITRGANPSFWWLLSELLEKETVVIILPGPSTCILCVSLSMTLVAMA